MNGNLRDGYIFHVHMHTHPRIDYDDKGIFIVAEGNEGCM